MFKHLIAKCKRNPSDSGAFREIILCYEAYIKRFVDQALRRKVIAANFDHDDLYQTFIAKVLFLVTKFNIKDDADDKENERLFAGLIGIALRNEISDLQYRLTRKCRFPPGGVINDDHLGAASSRQQVNVEEIDLVDAVKSKLRSRARSVLSLKLRGHKEDRIANVLGLSSYMVKKILLGEIADAYREAAGLYDSHKRGGRRAKHKA